MNEVLCKKGMDFCTEGLVRVDVEHVRSLLRSIRQINRLKFSDIEFYKDGVKVELDPAVVKHWKFTGLCNTDFVDIHLEGVM